MIFVSLEECWGTSINVVWYLRFYFIGTPSGTRTHNLPPHWFIYTFLGMGIVLCSGHVVANTVNGHCLSCYMLSVNLLLIHILPKSFVHWYDAFHSLSIACNSVFKSFDGEAWSLWILRKFSYCIRGQNPQSFDAKDLLCRLKGKWLLFVGDSITRSQWHIISREWIRCRYWPTWTVWYAWKII